MSRQRVEDFLYDFEGYHGYPSQCRIQIFSVTARSVVVVASELPDNPGTSITNRAEWIANQLYERLDQPEDFIWIEHYPEDAYGGNPDPEHTESFAIVEFDVENGKLTRPDWTHVTKPQVEQLIHRPLEV